MSELRDTLERLVAPPARAEFHDELWGRLQASERAAARRWRAAAIVATAVAVAATSAVGVLAFGRAGGGTFDRTLSCPVPEKGGVNLLDLFARTRGAKATQVGFIGQKLPNPATVEVDVGRQITIFRGIWHVLQTTYAGASPAMKDGYTFDQTLCHEARSIPLAPAGLPAAGVFAGGHGGGVRRECWVAPVVTARMRVTTNGSALPVRAKLALRTGRRLRPVAYVEWTPTLVRAWISPGFCHRLHGY